MKEDGLMIEGMGLVCAFILTETNMRANSSAGWYFFFLSFFIPSFKD